jgi:hypothetical protein
VGSSKGIRKKGDEIFRRPQGQNAVGMGCLFYDFERRASTGTFRAKLCDEGKNPFHIEKTSPLS